MFRYILPLFYVISSSIYGNNYIVVKPYQLEMLKPSAGEMSVIRSNKLSLKESTSMGGLLKLLTQLKKNL